MDDRAGVVDAVLGAPDARGLDSRACYIVAAVLGTAAFTVAGWPKQPERPRRVAALGIAAVLAGRGALGLSGHTHLVSPISTSQRFQRLDRRVYSPLSLTLAGLTALSLTDALPPRFGSVDADGRQMPRGPNRQQVLAGGRARLSELRGTRLLDETAALNGRLTGRTPT